MLLDAHGAGLGGAWAWARRPAFNILRHEDGSSTLMLSEGVFSDVAMHALRHELVTATTMSAETVRAGFSIAGEAVRSALQSHSGPEIGWTLVGAGSLAHVSPGEILFAWQGPTRALLVRDSRLVFENEEHTLRLQQLLAGMPPEEAQKLGRVLTRGLGVPGEPEIKRFADPRPGDLVVIWSEEVDGAFGGGQLPGLSTGGAEVERLVSSLLDAARARVPRHAPGIVTGAIL